MSLYLSTLFLGNTGGTEYGEITVNPKSKILFNRSELAYMSTVFSTTAGLISYMNVRNLVSTQNLLGLVSTQNLLNIVSTQNLLGLVSTPNLLNIISTPNLLNIVSTPNLLNIISTVNLIGGIAFNNLSTTVISAATLSVNFIYASSLTTRTQRFIDLGTTTIGDTLFQSTTYLYFGANVVAPARVAPIQTITF
jgi:hypothetical protein